MQELPVQSFTDYRAFLLVHAQGQRTKNPRWRVGMWAKRLGLKSTSSVTKILQGKREPGREITDRFVRYFSFNAKEADYFRDLVRLRKVQKDPRLSTILMEKMEKQHPEGTIRLLDDKEFFVIAHWYVLAIRELTRMPGFSADTKKISQRFLRRVSPREVGKALEALLATGMLVRQPDGSLQVSQGRVHSRNDVASEAIKRHHEQMLENAKVLLREVPVAGREFTAATLVFREERMPEAKQLIREFREKFSKLMEDVSGENVYQIQVQFFPLTRKPKGSRVSNKEIACRVE